VERSNPRSSINVTLMFPSSFHADQRIAGNVRCIHGKQYTGVPSGDPCPPYHFRPNGEGRHHILDRETAQHVVAKLRADVCRRRDNDGGYGLAHIQGSGGRSQVEQAGGD